jgi:maltokinase
MTAPADLTDLVQQWIGLQRWFGGKGRAAEITLSELAILPGTDPEVTIWLVRADYGAGGVETYQLPLVVYPAPMAALDHVQLGTLTTPDGRTGWVYDALHDKAVTGAWLTGIRDGVRTGSLVFHNESDAAAIPVQENSLVLSGEQSNTSLAFSDAAILKVFRRVQPGVNPDVEIHTALSRHGGKHLARILGSVEAVYDGQSHSLAMLQEFMTTATDGWEAAKTSVRDLMAEADLHAEEAGGDFAAESHRLGAAVAQVHRELAEAFGTELATPEDVLADIAAMRARLAEAATAVPGLDVLAPALDELFAASLVAEPGGIRLQRVHGDLHLAQALRTVHRWVIIDFEGEPLVALADRRALRSALRDVAGMLRSFDYVAQQYLLDTRGEPIGSPDANQQLAYRAAEWTQRNQDAFCTGYAEVAESDPREHADWLRALEADKAIYEAVYESRNRPTWLPIPMAALTRLAEGGD